MIITLILILFGIISIIIIIFFLGLYVGRKISNSRAKKRLSKIYNASPYRQDDQKKPKPSDEFKSRDERKEIVTGQIASQAYKQAKKNNTEVEQHEEEQKVEAFDPITGLTKPQKASTKGIEQGNIVGIAPQLGFWTRLVTSQKLSFLMAMGRGNKKNAGFFVNLINAQATSQSKEKGRGR